MICRNCGSEIVEGAMFCINCGEKVQQTIDLNKSAKVCKNCGSEISEDMKFCAKCGAGVEETTLNENNDRQEVCYCRKCGSVLAEGAEFCIICGEKIIKSAEFKNESAAVNICKKCGANLKPDAKFCNRCGFSADEKNDIPEDEVFEEKIYEFRAAADPNLVVSYLWASPIYFTLKAKHLEVEQVSRNANFITEIPYSEIKSFEIKNGFNAGAIIIGAILLLLGIIFLICGAISGIVWVIGGLIAVINVIGTFLTINVADGRIFKFRLKRIKKVNLDYKDDMVNNLTIRADKYYQPYKAPTSKKESKIKKYSTKN